MPTSNLAPAGAVAELPLTETSGDPALRIFLRAMTELVGAETDPAVLQARGAALLRELVASPDWLALPFRATEENFRQLLLYMDPLERFSLVAFVWGRDAHETPIHDHRMWGAIGVLEGEEISTEMIPDPAGGPMRAGRSERLKAGEVMLLGGQSYDIHLVQNGRPGEVGVTVHLYGGNIGGIARAMYDQETSEARLVQTGYDNKALPNPWV